MKYVSKIIFDVSCSTLHKLPVNNLTVTHPKQRLLVQPLANGIEERNKGRLDVIVLMC